MINSDSLLKVKLVFTRWIKILCTQTNKFVTSLSYVSELSRVSAAFKLFNVSLPAICVLPFETTHQELSDIVCSHSTSTPLCWSYIRGFVYQRLVCFVETARPGICLNCFICQQECYYKKGEMFHKCKLCRIGSTT